MPEPIEEQSNLNALLNTMVEGMIIQDSSGRIIQYNQAALEILGMAEGQLNEPEVEAGQTEKEMAEPSAMEAAEWDKIFPGKDHPGMESLKTGQIQKNLVMRIFRYDGEVRWISLNAVPIINNRTGKPYQVINTFTDITEMRRMLNELKQVQLLYNISQDIMIITNQEGYFKKVNPRFTEVLGYDFREIGSKKFTNLIHPEDLEATLTALKKVTPNKSIHFINRYLEKKGEYRTFDWVVVKDTDTGLLYYTARDITDYRSEELDIMHSSRVYSIGELTSGLAYMINGQISIIGGHLSFIKSLLNPDQDQINTADVRRKVQGIEESVQRLSKAIKDLNSFMRNAKNEEVTDVSLTHVLDNVLELSYERFRIHCVALEVNLENNLYIRCRETQVAQVLITLLNNCYTAVHSQRDGWVKLAANSKNRIITITVEDNRERKDKTELNVVRSILEENFGAIYYDHTGPYSKFVIEFQAVPVVQ